MESIAILEAEVEEMGARVMEMRREGPVRFRSILDDYLRKLRPLAAEPRPKAPEKCAVRSEDIESLQARFAAAMDSLPELLERVKRCTSELERRKAARLRDSNKPHSLVFDVSLRAEDFAGSDLSSREIVQLLQEK